jgi:Flp pilus assembly protein TadG
MKTISRIRRRARRCVRGLIGDSRGVAAVEFAVIVPIMLVLFFGVVEFSSAISVDRKLSMIARTLSDLTSQSLSSTSDTEMQNIFAASASILTPYSVTPTLPTISEIYIDANKVAKIQWTTSATIAMVSGAPKATLKASAHTKGDIVTVPPGLQVPKSFLIWSEVNYTYVPTVGYVMAKAGVPLHDQNYTRPRQSTCVDYPAVVAPAVACTPVP